MNDATHLTGTPAKHRTARLASRLPRFVRDTGGTAILEFAFVAAPLIALLLGSLQISIIFLTQQNLETVSERAVRKIMTGGAQGARMTADQFRTWMCGGLPALLSCRNLIVDVKTYNSFDQVDTAAPTLNVDAAGNVTNSWSYAPGDGDAIVVLRAMYRMPLATRPMNLDLTNSAGSARLLVSTSVFKNEPF